MAFMLWVCAIVLEALVYQESLISYFQSTGSSYSSMVASGMVTPAGSIACRKLDPNSGKVRSRRTNRETDASSKSFKSFPGDH